MQLTVSLSPEAEAQLRAKALAAGTDVAGYAARLLEAVATPPPSLATISGPLYQQFLGSGMTDDELGDLLEQAKHEMRAEQRRQRHAS